MHPFFRATFLLLLLSLCLSACGQHKVLTVLNPELAQVEKQRLDLKKELDALGKPMIGQTAPQFGYMPGMARRTDPEWVQVDLGSPHAIQQIALIPAQTDSNTLGTPVYKFPHRFRIDVSNDPEFSACTPVADYTAVDFPTPGIGAEMWELDLPPLRYVRVTVYQPRDFAIAELMVISGNRNIAIECPVTASSSMGPPTAAIIAYPPRWELLNIVDGRTPLGPPIVLELPKHDGLYIGSSVSQPIPFAALDLGQILPVQEVRLHPIHARGGVDIPGFAFPGKFRVEGSATADFAAPTVLREASATGIPNPGNNVVTYQFPPTDFRYLRVIMVNDGNPDLYFGLSEIEVYSNEKNVARQAQVSISSHTKGRGDWPNEILNDGYASFGRILELPVWLNDWNRRKSLQKQREELDALHAGLLNQAFQKLWWLFGGTGAVLLTTTSAYLLHTNRQRRIELNRFRQQLANDFHDEIGSNLAAIAALGESAARHPPENPPDDFRKLSAIARETTDAMHETLWITGARSDLTIDLVKHLQLAAARTLPAQKVRWQSLPEAFPSEWSSAAKRHLFLFFKESLANIVRHSGADTVDLSVQVVNGLLELKIQDNGRGFDPQVQSAGVGLRSLQQRASALKGTMQIETNAKSGTCVNLRVPIQGMKSIR